MRIGLVAVTGTMAVLLAGCDPLATFSGPGKGGGTPAARAQQDCKNRPTCDIDVDLMTGVVPERVFVSVGQATAIRWKLPQGSRWKWGERGVEFKPPGDTVFNCPSGQSGLVRTCNKPANAPGGTFEYFLHLVYDPFLVNE
ncbi:MAG: hypothetical protein OEX23_14360 [Betaproteobacteria bacterium]|nr:hypothetical protein [Betaproteobacteria bacterium]